MTIEQFRAMLKEKGVASLTPEVLANANLSLDEMLAVIQATVNEEVNAQVKPLREKIEAGGDNGVAGSGNSRDMAVQYVSVPARQFCATALPGEMITVPRVPKGGVGSNMKKMLAHIEKCVRSHTKFYFESSLDPDMKASTSEADPANAGITMPQPFEEAMIDYYIAASGWLSKMRVIRGASKNFWFPVRTRTLSTTDGASNRVKTLTSLTVRKVGEGARPVETENTPWGFQEGKAVRYACYGRITREMLRGNPRSVNDFMTEMTRAITDTMSYDAAWGLGEPQNEVLGFLNQVDPKYAPLVIPRATTDHVKRVDILNMIKGMHDYGKTGAFFMGKGNTRLDLSYELDKNDRPIFVDQMMSVTQPIEDLPLMGYDFVKNWQAPVLGDKGDMTFLSPQANWVFFQEAMSLRSSDQVEFIEGNLIIVGETGWNFGVIAGLNKLNVVLKKETS